MRVVLGEATDAGETGQRARSLVAVQDAKFGHAQRQLAVRPFSYAEDQAVARAVHRLERELLLLDVDCAVSRGHSIDDAPENMSSL